MACYLYDVLVVLILLYAGGPRVKSDLENRARWQVFNITCDPHDVTFQEERCESESLEIVADIVREQKYINVQINIKITRLKLISSVNFTKLESLVISGEYGVTSIICVAGSNTSAGIILSDVSGTITLNSLNLSFCGTHAYVGSTIFQSAITMVYCMNVQLNGLIIAKSRGVGLTILHHQGGKVNIDSTIFNDNVLPQEYIWDSVLGGGGVYILLYQNGHGQLLYSPSLMFRFNNCTFENNIAHTFNYSFGYTNNQGKVEKGYGQGGGVHLSVRGGLRNIHASFSNCKFIGNHAFTGGGMYIKIFGSKLDKKTNNVTTVIKDSLFEYNGCGKSKNKGTSYGGAAYLAFTAYARGLHGSVINDSHYLVRNVSFIENCAELGGGIMYYSNHGKRGISDNINNSMLFDNSTFTSNRAHIGSAVNLIPSVFVKTSRGYRVIATFNHCRFLKNSVFISSSKSQGNQTTPGIGTIYASEHDIHFNGSNLFESNNGTAVYIVNGVINCVNSSMTFINNIGLQGGAVALIGSSMITVGPSKYEFINNTALYQGGAIYVLLTDSIDFIVSRSCFIKYDTDKISAVPWNANITFIGNKAIDDTAGHSIYATSLHPCQVINNGTKNQPEYVLVNTSEVFKIRGITINDGTMHNQIRTDGALFHISKNPPLVIIPGEKYQHGVTITDDLDQLVHASLKVAIGKKTEDVELYSAHSIFTGDEIQLRGKPDHNSSLYFYTVSSRQSYVKLDVQLTKCPPGFKLNDNLTCICNAEAHVGLLNCDSDKFQSHIHPGYWAGLMESHEGLQPELVTSPCPFCDYSIQRSHTSVPEFEVALPRNYSKLSETVCGETRTGIACGRCRKNHTMHFHSPGFLCKPDKPIKCKLGLLFYLLSELLPVTAFFIIVLGMNISFTAGAVNGFILFCQLLSTLDIHASGIILVFPDSAKHALNYWTQGYQIIYGFFNLDFFNSESLSFCFWKGASAVDMLALKYVTILYTLLLIMFVIWITNKCGGRCCGKCCRMTTVRTSVVHGISTFLVICYTQCVKVSLYLLMPVHLYVEDKRRFRPPARVWFNGEMHYFSKQHLPYALFAIFCLLTIGILPLVPLLTYPSLNKVLTILGCENSKAVTTISNKIPVTRLKPLLDSIQGCFKDDFRPFAGFYFLYRWTILLVRMNTSRFSVYYIAVGGALLFLSTVHTICQPYIKRAHNIIDALLFTNLILINLLSFFNYHRSRTPKGIVQGTTLTSSIIQLVLIYLPLVLMGVYILVRLCKSISKYGCRKLLTRITTMLIHQRANRLSEMVQTIRAKNNDMDSNEQFIHERILDKDSVYPKYFGART